MSLRSYLQKHFVDKAVFADLSGISPERLDALTAAQAIPNASYVCDGHSIRSQAFGAIGTEEHLTGEYFRPECARWARIADKAPAGAERSAVQSVLTSELSAALDVHGVPSAVAQAKIRDYLPYFWDGTFGLCVAEPSSGAGIARKEIFQERLTSLTDNGRNPSPAGTSPTELLQLIDDYADAAMPFSPAEYERSSRKRLVDDLRPLVPKA